MSGSISSPPFARRLLPYRITLWMRNLLLTCVYTAICIISLYLGYELRYDFQVPNHVELQRFDVALWLIPLELVMLFAFGQFNSFLSFFRLPDLYRIGSAFGIVSLFLLYLWYVTDGAGCPPRSVIVGNMLLCVALISCFRVGLRIFRERYLGGNTHPRSVKRVAIIGANDIGATIASDMLAKRGLGLKPVIFLDKNKREKGKEIHGIHIAGSFDDLDTLVSRYAIDKAIIALPSSAHREIATVVKKARDINLPTEIVPSFSELATGQVKAARTRPVELEDLLGRDPITLDSEQILQLIQDKVVLVTGAGGSIGSELCRQILARGPKRLILLDQSEVQLFPIEQELSNAEHRCDLLPLVADILDAERMRSIFKLYQPQIVFHAAAHKHVPMMERQPGEAIRNNAIGTASLACLASEMAVDCFILISTDKAINPTNVMGATKRLAEIAIQAVHSRPTNKTRFMAVRFGNVLGSSGSVILTFKQQIAQGGPVTVTHPEVSRYFMTIPEAVGLVLQCATLGQGGEIFVLDMGQPIKIIDVARQLIELSGFTPDVDIEIKFIGLRPGEKLYEELQHTGEQFADTVHPRISRFICTPKPYEKIQQHLTQLEQKAYSEDRNELKRLIQKFVPEYQPYLD